MQGVDQPIKIMLGSVPAAVWHDPDDIADILSLYSVQQYDSALADTITVITPDGKLISVLTMTISTLLILMLMPALLLVILITMTTLTAPMIMPTTLILPLLSL
jgi:hypothetical protein